ncbi:MAG: DUF2333 family protein [Pseudomonadota bacterium]|nr:MAG: DUF2333 family protein [Pseudomonadota bacterium]
MDLKSLFTDDLPALFARVAKAAGGFLAKLGSLYHPENIKQKGLVWTTGLAILTLSVILFFVGVYWSSEPEEFTAREAALAIAQGDEAQMVPGYITTAALITIGETLLDKPGGYLSNDKVPPVSLFGLYQMLDNMPSWEFGVVVMMRDTARVLRNDFSRSQSQSIEDPDLAEAEPLFNFDNNSWLFPPTEREYRKGIGRLKTYLERLAARTDPNTQFYTRADNLNELLAVVEKRLGSLTQRLNASVEELRVNTDLAGDTAAEQATPGVGLVFAKTPWLDIDDNFYEARGYVWALLHILRAIEIDFEKVLQKKNAVASLQQVIRLLEQTQRPTSSPVVLNGRPLGWMANYSKGLVSYISPANSAIIDLRNLLAQG